MLYVYVDCIFNTKRICCDTITILLVITQASMMALACLGAGDDLYVPVVANHCVDDIHLP